MCFCVSLAFFQRRDGVHWIRNDLCATRLTVKEYSARKVTGWLSNSRCVANELQNYQCEKWTQRKLPCQDEFVLAILKGLREQFQVGGKMEVCSIEPHFTGHEDEPIDEEDFAKFYDDMTGKLLLGHLARAARQEETKFLNTLPVYKKVQEANAKGKESVSVQWCDVNKGDSNNIAVQSRLVGREFLWKDPCTRGASLTGFKLVDDDTDEHTYRAGRTPSTLPPTSCA